MRRAPLVILVLWLVLCLGHEFWRVATFMAEPASGDLYAHTWGFQFVVFVVFRFGFSVAALLFALPSRASGTVVRAPQPPVPRPPPNNALQRTEAGSRLFSVYHAFLRQPPSLSLSPLGPTHAGHSLKI
jgi:hypothetical protein